ncbi:DUF4652 domain-containing protein [Bacillus pacificus]|uniref:DUF4652 domain-containing protein n=1 Tax=Bacillus cereus group TaxID=86661 RepID=UPI001E39B580|nr:DUF4652 domain-containing protein [Bacillus paranthracis]MCC2357694.1 DUF4652 domain-containing protein [Bacillus paranthracis]
MYNINYRRSDNHIEFLKSEEGSSKILIDDISSKPEVSPNGKKAIYLSPYEWEALSSLYLFDLETGENKELVGPNEEQFVPKYAIWIDDDHIAYTFAYAYGTISDGGNVYIYQISENRIHKVTDWDSKTQAVRIEYDGKVIKYEGVQYIDKEMNQYKEIDGELEIQLYLS